MSGCPGCRACIEGKIPDFVDEDEEEAFWDVHSPAQFPLRSVKVRLKGRGRPVALLPRQRVTLMLNPRLKERLIELAKKRGIGYQTLIQDYLLERVERELSVRPRGQDTT